MQKYLIMPNPGHNRVYFAESIKISLAELKLACSRFDMRCENIEQIYIAGIPYLSFDAAEFLGEKDLEMLSRLSFAYSIFMLEQNNKHLIPVEKIRYEYIDSNIGTILKYSGKTNELFTRMMINTALLSGMYYDEKNIELLDPMCGKGTTLYEGLVYGCNVSGVEIVDKAVHEAYVYFKKYLETEKYKHSIKTDKINGENRSFTSSAYRFELAKTKDELKNPKKAKNLTIISGNSIYADKYFKKNSFHIIVGDLPYGVSHGSVTDRKHSSLTRNPGQLLNSCLPSWRSVLKQGGVIALAWNTFIVSRNEMTDILTNNGFIVFTGSPYNEFEHRVDQAIKRDVIFAYKSV